jgi:hypothetical protein
MKGFLDVMKQGFKLGFGQWRIALGVYIFQACLAATLGIEVFQVLGASIGNSLQVNQLLSQYDHTVITDFLKVHGASITPLIGQMRWMVVAYILFSVFIHAGMMYAISCSDIQLEPFAFWKGGAKYFFSFLKMGGLFLVLFLCILACIWLPWLSQFEALIEYFDSEIPFVWFSILLLFLTFMLVGFFFIWSSLTRFIKIRDQGSIAQSLRCGWQLLWAKPLKYLGIMLFLLTIHLILIGIYFKLESLIVMSSALKIALLACVQQVYAFIKVVFRPLTFAVLYTEMQR